MLRRRRKSSSDTRTDTRKRSGRRKRRKPRRISRGYLERVAMHYLDRHASTRMRTRRVLMRRVRASLAEHNPPESPTYDPHAQDEAKALVESVLDHLEELGLLSDETFARHTLTRLRKKGKSSRAIRAYLSQRGVSRDLIDAVMEASLSKRATLFGETELETPRSKEEVELESAWTFMRRRRMGHFSHRESDYEQRTRDLAKLARAGFSYRIAKQALDTEPAEATLR